MGKKNVVLWDGTVAAVDEELARRLTGAGTGRTETVVEEGQRTQQAYDKANTSAGRAFVEGLADTATLGAYGAIVGETEGGHRMRVTAQQHSEARAFGEIVGVAAPTGLLGQTAKAATTFTAIERADKLGRAIGGLKGQAVEGAIVGLGAGVARTNVTGDPLTIESAILDVGVGAIANVGFAALGRKIRAKADTGQAELAAMKVEEASAEQLAKGKAVFDREYPALVEFNAARKAAFSSADDVNRTIQRANDETAEFFTSHKQRKAVLGGVDNAVNTVRSYYRPRGSFSTVDEALAATQQQAGVRADELNLNAGGVTPRQTVAGGPTGTSVGFRQGGLTPEGVRTSITEKVKLDSRPPMSPEIDDRLRRWSREASEIRQQLAGGRFIPSKEWQLVPEGTVIPPGAEIRMNLQGVTEARWANPPNKWTPYNKNVPAQPEEALKRLHALKEEIGKLNPDAAGKIPDLPTLPQKLNPVPAKGTVERSRIPSLEYLSRMDDASIQRIGKTLSPNEAEAVGRLAKDLDLKLRETPEATLAAVHAELKGYRNAMDAAELAEKDTQAAAGTGFGRLMRHASRLVGARAGNRLLGGGVVGGAVGWATGSMFGGLAGGMLMSSLMNGRAGLRSRITELFVKHGTKAGTTVEKLGPVGAVLAARITGDDEKKSRYADQRQLAKVRAQEFINLRGVANDVSYTAFEPFLAAPEDIALKLHTKWTGVINHLADVAPKDPGLSIRGFDSSWVPTYNEAREFAHRVEAAFEPLKAITRAIQGGGHPAAAETLWTAWPGVMATLAEELAFFPETLAKLSHSQLSAFSRLFRTPLSGFQVPEIALAAQAMYQPGAAGNPYADNPDAGFGNSPQNLQPQGGRPPAAGRSEVAGSNVSRLTE